MNPQNTTLSWLDLELKKLKAETIETYNQAKSNNDYPSATNALKLRRELLQLELLGQSYSQQEQTMMTPSFTQPDQSPTEPTQWTSTSKSKKTILD